MSSVGTVFVFIPDTLPKNGTGFLSGFVVEEQYEYKIFITSDILYTEETNKIGYCGPNLSQKNRQHYRLCVDHDKNGYLKINYIHTTWQFSTLIVVYYDYCSFCSSELLQATYNNTDNFSVLAKALNTTSTNNDTKCKENSKSNGIFKALESVLQTSHTARLMRNSIRTIHCISKQIRQERKISLAAGNVIIARFVDVALGILLLLWLWPSWRAIDETADTLVERLRQLLHDQLMGSPVGLKLNHALNSALGRFFLYHIALWRAFIATAVTWTTPGVVLWTARALASLGISFQAALVADALALATFHVYCIYVYAARLYGAQIRGLASLWWLFVGRKRNPLRARVDSCKYSHRQLFVGTLAFTILLFLLPTIAMYYAVFTTLRLALTIADRSLSTAYRTVLGLPVYVSWLWALDSARTRTTIQVWPTRAIPCTCPTTRVITLRATLRTGTWAQCVRQAAAISRLQRLENEVGQATTGIASFGTLVRCVALGKLL